MVFYLSRRAGEVIEFPEETKIMHRFRTAPDTSIHKYFHPQNFTTWDDYLTDDPNADPAEYIHAWKVFHFTDGDVAASLNVRGDQKTFSLYLQWPDFFGQLFPAAQFRDNAYNINFENQPIYMLPVLLRSLNPLLRAVSAYEAYVDEDDEYEADDVAGSASHLSSKVREHLSKGTGFTDLREYFPIQAFAAMGADKPEWFINKYDEHEIKARLRFQEGDVVFIAVRHPVNEMFGFHFSWPQSFRMGGFKEGSSSVFRGTSLKKDEFEELLPQIQDLIGEFTLKKELEQHTQHPVKRFESLIPRELFKGWDFVNYFHYVLDANISRPAFHLLITYEPGLEDLPGHYEIRTGSPHTPLSVPDFWIEQEDEFPSEKLLKLIEKKGKENQPVQLEKEEEDQPIKLENQRFPISKRAQGKYIEKKKEESGNITYIYSDKHVKERNKKKAKKILELSKSIKKVRKQVQKDIASKEPVLEDIATVVGLIDDTYERVGNPSSAKEDHHGVTTWRVKHVTFGKGKATIKYVGKAGVKQEKIVESNQLVAALKRAIKDKKKNDEIFPDINGRLVNLYLKPFNITAKDIRGFHANEEMKQALKSSRNGTLPKDPKEKEKKLKDEFKEALELAAKKVGHEPTTLKNQYLIPSIEEHYLTSGKIKVQASWEISKRAQEEEEIDLRKLFPPATFGGMGIEKTWDFFVFDQNAVAADLFTKSGLIEFGVSILYSENKYVLHINWPKHYNVEGLKTIPLEPDTSQIGYTTEPIDWVKIDDLVTHDQLLKLVPEIHELIGSLTLKAEQELEQVENMIERVFPHNIFESWGLIYDKLEHRRTLSGSALFPTCYFSITEFSDADKFFISLTWPKDLGKLLEPTSTSQYEFTYSRYVPFEDEDKLDKIKKVIKYLGDLVKANILDTPKPEPPQQENPEQ